MDMLSISNSNDTTNTTSSTASFVEFHTAGWIFSLLVVLPENVYVIWLIVTGAGNGVVSEFFSLNLSVCEIFLSLQCFLALLSKFCLNLWFPVRFLSGIPAIGRPLFQCVICVERYLAVVHPVTFLKYKPLRYRLISSAVAWIIILSSCLFANFAFFQFHMFWFMCFYLSQALFTFSVMLFCCLAVLRALKKSGPRERKRDEENHMKRRAFNIIVMITMSMLVIYGSYLFSALSYILTHEINLTLWTVGHVFFLLGGLVQPLLYLHRTGKLPFCKTLQSCCFSFH